VDLILEKEIFNNLKNLKILENKTIILTSHRLTTVRNSDFVFFIDKEHGLYEEGRTDELLLGNSKLYEYFQQQMV
jgi:ATP-binding cassette subfamily B protein